MPLHVQPVVAKAIERQQHGEQKSISTVERLAKLDDANLAEIIEQTQNTGRGTMVLVLIRHKITKLLEILEKQEIDVKTETERNKGT